MTARSLLNIESSKLLYLRFPVLKISYGKPSKICNCKLHIPETSWIVFTAPRFYFWTGCVNSLAFVASFELLITNFWPPTTKFSYLVTSSPPCSTCPPWGQKSCELYFIFYTSLKLNFLAQVLSWLVFNSKIILDFFSFSLWI